MDFDYWKAKFEALPGTVEKKDHTMTFYYKGRHVVAHVNGAGIVVILNIDVFGWYAVDSLVIDKRFLDSTGFVKQEVLDRDSLTAARHAAVEERKAFFEEFKKAVFENCNVPLDHPKGDKLWELARMNGETYGLGRIYDEVEEMSQLLS